MQIALVLHDDPAFGLGVHVLFQTQRFVFDDVLEADAAAALGEDRDAVRVPVAQHLPGHDLLAFLDLEVRSRWRSSTLPGRDPSAPG